MATKVATLGKAGCVEDIDLKIDYMMCCYFFSKYSQTTYFKDNVHSLTKVIQQFGNDPFAIAEKLKQDLYSFLSEGFTSVTLDVTLDTTTVGPGISLLIEGIVSDGDSIDVDSRSIGYALTAKDSMLKTILNTNSGNTLYSN
ncbi:hypothetical protein D3C85_429270 [compost metagenome]